MLPPPFLSQHTPPSGAETIEELETRLERLVRFERGAMERGGNSARRDAGAASVRGYSLEDTSGFRYMHVLFIHVCVVTHTCMCWYMCLMSLYVFDEFIRMC